MRSQTRRTHLVYLCYPCWGWLMQAIWCIDWGVTFTPPRRVLAHHFQDLDQELIRNLVKICFLFDSTKIVLIERQGLFSHVNTPYTIFSIEVLYSLATLCLNGRLSCVDFVDVITGEAIWLRTHRCGTIIIWLVPHVNTIELFNSINVLLITYFLTL